MGVFINNKSVEFLYYSSRKIGVIYNGARIIWQAIRSCFGAGYWRGDKPWIGSEPWRG